MLMEYKGERFRVSTRTYENFQRDHPNRAEKLKKIPDSEKYYNYDKLLQLIEPTTNETKDCLLKNYIYAEDQLAKASMDMKIDDMDKYFGAKEMIRKISIELLNYDPEKALWEEIFKEEP